MYRHSIRLSAPRIPQALRAAVYLALAAPVVITGCGGPTAGLDAAKKAKQLADDTTESAGTDTVPPVPHVPGAPAQIKLDPQALARVAALKAAEAGLAMPVYSTWKVKPDPSPYASEKIAPKADLLVEIPGDSNSVRYPAVFSPFVSAGKNDADESVRTIYDLRTGTAVGAIRGKQEVDPAYELSADGRHLVAKGSILRKQTTFDVWDTATGRSTTIVVDPKESHLIDFVGFGPPGHVVLSEHHGLKRKIQVWDFAAGKKVREFGTEAYFNWDKATVSPGGRYVALDTFDHDIRLYDLTDGSFAGRILPTALALDGLKALAFSPDGTEMAGLFEPSVGRSRIIAWDVAKGEVVVDHAVNGSPSVLTPSAGLYDRHVLEYVPDGSGWLAYGHVLIDRGAGRIVRVLTMPPLYHNLGHNRMLEPDHVVTAFGQYGAGGGRLKSVPLPWLKVDASLKAMSGAEPVILRPGTPVALDVSLAGLNNASPEQTRESLVKALTGYVETSGMTVAASAPITLRVRYGESVGETLQEMRSNGPIPSPFGGTPTGRTVQATKANCEIAWIKTGQRRPLWSRRFEYNPSMLHIQGELTDAKVRDQIFNTVLVMLGGEPLPYFIPAESDADTLVMLPGRTSLVDEAPKPRNVASKKSTRRGQSADSKMAADDAKSAPPGTSAPTAKPKRKRPL